jgi:RNA polymerase sigma factor (sigma-70 family)
LGKKRTEQNSEIETESFNNRFTLIFEKEKKNIFSTAYYILGCKEDSEEIVQSAFLKLWEKRKTLDDIENVSAWLKKIAANLCIDKLRAARRVKRTPVFQLQSDFPESKKRTEILIQKEVLDIVMESVKLLPPVERTVILLYTFGGLTTTEIAVQLGTASSTVRNQVLQARKKINEIIRKKYEKS